MVDEKLENLFYYNTFECGKTYKHHGHEFTLVRRTLCGVPNAWWGEFKSDVFPFHFKVQIHNNGTMEYFGKGNDMVVASAAFDHEMYSRLQYEKDVFQYAWYCVDAERYRMPDSAVEVVNAALKDSGYMFYLSNTCNKWCIQSEWNKTYFCAEELGYFSSLYDAFHTIYKKIMDETEPNPPTGK